VHACERDRDGTWSKVHFDVRTYISGTFPRKSAQEKLSGGRVCLWGLCRLSLTLFLQRGCELLDHSLQRLQELPVGCLCVVCVYACVRKRDWVTLEGSCPDAAAGHVWSSLPPLQGSPPLHFCYSMNHGHHHLSCTGTSTPK
jgi:hypothetical protein